MTRKLLIALAVFAASTAAAKSVYATMEEPAADVKSAWKDSNGFCPAGCDASKYDCPCVIITAEQ